MGICYNITEHEVQKEVGYDLPPEVVIEILSRLPVKSLMRFRCICKLWCSLTKDLSFIAKHLKQEETDNKKNGRLLVHHYDQGSNKFLFALFPDETLALPCYQYPYLELNSDARVLGPCNGLFCLFNGWDAVALWNPAMRQFRTLPEFPLPELPSIGKLWSYSVFGFGMDPKTHDYKVIWIRVFYDKEEWYDMVTFDHYIQVGVFSLSSDSWRELNGNLVPVDDVYDSNFYSYANGFYYWFAGDKDDRFILSFDMVNEVFLAIPEPGGIPESVKDVSWKQFAFYEGSVARILYDREEDRCYTVWVLKDGCWTKEVTIGPLLGVEIPLGFWKDGGLLLQSRTTAELVVSNPITGEIKNVGIEDPKQVFICTESLVSVEGGRDYSMGKDLPDFFDVPCIQKEKIEINAALRERHSSDDFHGPPSQVYLEDLLPWGLE